MNLIILMPKKPIDYVYDKGFVYSIRDQDDQVLYVGSTVNFKSRKRHHKDNFLYPSLKEYYYQTYEVMRSISSNFDDFIFKIEETCHKVTKLDLKAPENKHKKILNPIGNTQEIRPEIQIHSSDDKNAYKRELYKLPDYKEKIKQYRDENYKNNKEKILERNKQYRDSNKEEIKQHQKQFREQNKEKIKQQKSRPWNCQICNCNVAIDGKARHCKTKKHLENSKIICNSV